MRASVPRFWETKLKNNIMQINNVFLEKMKENIMRKSKVPLTTSIKNICKKIKPKNE